MGFVRPRLRATACSAAIAALLFTLIPLSAVAAAAPAATDPAANLSALITSPVVPADLVLPDLIPSGGQSRILDLLLPTALLTGAPANLLAIPESTSKSLAALIVAGARSHLGARYVWGAAGPRVFDCSGLVLRVYSDAGLVGKLGGWGNRSGYALLAYGRRHHLVSSTNGEPGDIVVWGGGGHVGIYLGNGMAISALVSGVRIHGIYAVTKRFTAFIHTGLSHVAITASSAGVSTKVVTPTRSTATSSKAAALTTATRAAAAAKAVAAAKAAKALAAKSRFAKVALLLRSSASTSATVVLHLSSGTRLLVLRSIHDSHKRVWFHVKASGHTGWVAGWLTRA